MKKPFIRFNNRYINSLIYIFVALVLSLALWIAEKPYEIRIPTDQQNIEVFSTQNNDLRPTILTAINQAKDSILLFGYTLKDYKVLEALRKKGEEGLKVQVIVDATATPHAEVALGPNVKIIKRFTSGLMHLKLLVIDQKYVFAGTANFTSDALLRQGNMVLGFNLPPLAKFIQAKADAMNETSNQKDFPHQRYQFTNQTIEFWFLPDDYRGVSKIKELIQSAKKSIHVAMFAWTRRDFATALVNAHNRGVKVDVVINHQSLREDSFAIARYLKENGIEVRRSDGPHILHYKTMIVDDSILVNGSANWTRKAFRENDDFFIVIDPLLASQAEVVSQIWKKIMQESIPW
ncbi:MAG: hypothetical protein BGO10_05005 [Chlamydia sp. 32-24]|nr:MAG: hypothetical protein BGO10_05005 [Chlamydia sp. 32-24]